jgi:Zn-dependent membrane protease YugP
MSRLPNTALVFNQPQQAQYMTIDETKEQLAKIVGEKRESVREMLENMEAEGISCIPIEDVRIILTEHYNFMYQLIYAGR